MTCKATCHTLAISSHIDKLGFTVPRINPELCIDCQACKRVCPAINDIKTDQPINTFAVSAKEESVLKQTSSGGLASILANLFLENGGIVYGCDGTDISHVQHKRITNLNQLPTIQGSKYIQSDISKIFNNLLTDLRNQKDVLFIGVSCQVAGIKQYLRRDFPNLYTIDIICHGAASQQMLDQNINYHKKKLGLKSIHNVKFRQKYYDSSLTPQIRYGLFFDSNNSHFSFTGIKDPFTYAYSNNQLFRDSCYSCKYTKPERVADITLGDFWKLGQDSILIKQLGVSLCITHTDKGDRLLSKVSDLILIEKRELNEAINGNPQLIEPTKAHTKLRYFRNEYIKNGLYKAVLKTNRKQILKIRLYNIAKKLGITTLRNYFLDKCHK